VTATWQLLQSRLNDLDLDVEEATSRLYHSLTSNGAGASEARHPVRSE
jgi:hypothetical protein